MHKKYFFLFCCTVCFLISLLALSALFFGQPGSLLRDVADEEAMPLTEIRVVDMLRDMVGNLESKTSDKKIAQHLTDPTEIVNRLNTLLPVYFKRSRKEALPQDETVLRLFLITKTAPRNFNKRLKTRQTWLSLALQSSSCMCHMPIGGRCTRFSRLCQYRHLRWFHRFLVGMNNQDVSLMRMVLKEGMEHLDMLWYPEEDHYRRLTWKVHWAMVWVMEHVSVDYVMFVDDDSFMHLPHLATYLVTAPRTRLYGGRVPFKDALVVRNKQSKWYVREDAFPDKLYPRYVWGAGVLLSFDVVDLFVRSARTHTVWFSVDDAFLGLVLNVSGLGPTNIKSIYPASSVYRGCHPSVENQQPILITSIDEAHRDAMMNYAMGSISLCSLLVSPLWWKLTTFVQSYAFFLLVLVVALFFCRPYVQRPYLFRLIVYV